MEASITQKRKTSPQLHWCSLSWHWLRLWRTTPTAMSDRTYWRNCVVNTHLGCAEGSKFNNYLNTVNILINSHEPQGKLNKKQRKFEQKPWITWGMENSIHQNRLYRNYTRRNIKNVERVLYDECRAYRNNLSTLMI